MSTPKPLNSMDQFRYCPCYCEENVFHLLAKLAAETGSDLCDLFCVFLTSPGKQFPILRQKNGSGDLGQIVWDYHVLAIMYHTGERFFQVWDLDTTMNLPAPFAEYADQALLLEQPSLAPFDRRFRVVSGRRFLAHFSSDRRHMRRQGDGQWLASPPDWPPIEASEPLCGSRCPEGHSLPLYLDVDKLDVVPFPDWRSAVDHAPRGVVVNEHQLRRMFS